MSGPIKCFLLHLIVNNLFEAIDIAEKMHLGVKKNRGVTHKRIRVGKIATLKGTSFDQTSSSEPLCLRIGSASSLAFGHREKS